ncbi:unnamed protein product [Eruca vesicaria subsp. sativa]|uniref:Uncharacterized protein n=1 Tax=Eruca vesicaria subsp. sativa TaxID=29727 RepID=A0ABC8LWF5_ERUVS|nr:unnamed protein product [Eruca vesicaria subsp. sativa]
MRLSRLASLNFYSGRWRFLQLRCCWSLSLGSGSFFSSAIVGFYLQKVKVLIVFRRRFYVIQFIWIRFGLRLWIWCDFQLFARSFALLDEILNHSMRLSDVKTKRGKKEMDSVEALWLYEF